MPTLPDVNAVLAFLKRIDLCRGLNGQALGEIAFILLPIHAAEDEALICLLYTSPSPRDATLSRMPSSA